MSIFTKLFISTKNTILKQMKNPKRFFSDDFSPHFAWIYVHFSRNDLKIHELSGTLHVKRNNFIPLNKTYLNQNSLCDKSSNVQGSGVCRLQFNLVWISSRCFSSKAPICITTRFTASEGIAYGSKSHKAKKWSYLDQPVRAIPLKRVTFCLCNSIIFSLQLTWFK